MPRMPLGMRLMCENRWVAYLTACKCPVKMQFFTERCMPNGMRQCALFPQNQGFEAFSTKQAFTISRLHHSPKMELKTDGCTTPHAVRYASLGRTGVNTMFRMPLGMRPMCENRWVAIIVLQISNLYFRFS